MIYAELAKIREFLVNNISVRASEDEKLNFSWETESSFLKPYFHFVQKSSGAFKELEMVDHD